MKLAGAPPVKQAFGAPAADELPPSHKFNSKFYIVRHNGAEGKKTQDWWKAMEPMMEDPSKMEAMHAENLTKDLFNHAFMPIASDLIFCIWEAKDEESVHARLDSAVTQEFFKNTAFAVEPSLNGGVTCWNAKIAVTA